MHQIEFGSVCSGIEAASVAWHPIGWRAAWLAEIEPFPSVLLDHHYPDVPNLGDMTTIAARVITGEVQAPDVLAGGTPCQAFSVAGLRRSLDDERGNLSLKFVELANAIDFSRSRAGKPACVVMWENVPGVLNTKDNAFGCFLAGLAGEDDQLQPPGGKWSNAGCIYGPTRTVAWRTLDAQYFGVAQRRRRVFVVASARAGFDPVQVLFEWHGMRRDSAPSRKARQVAPTIPSRSTAGGGLGTDFDLDGGVITMAHGQGGAEIARDRSPCLTCNHEAPIAAIPQTTHTLRGEGFDASEDGIGRGVPLIPVAFDTTQITSAANGSNPLPGDPCHPLAAGAHAPAIAFPANLSGTQCASTENLSPSLGATNPTAVAIQDIRGTDKAQNGCGWNDEGAAYTLDTHATQGVAYTTKLHNTGSNNAGKVFEERTPCLDANSQSPALLTATQVRRLTPIECERLQGFPDNYTAIPWRGKPADQCPDGPRYKALGNSWAVPVARWIGRRIQTQLEQIKDSA